MNIEIVINRAGIYGGVKRLYAVAEYLREAGHNVVVNSEDRKKNTWFQHSIPENVEIKAQIRICAETCRKLLPDGINILYQQAQFDAPEPDEKFDLVVTTTKYLSETLKNWSVVPDYVIPYGIDSTVFKPVEGYTSHENGHHRYVRLPRPRLPHPATFVNPITNIESSTWPEPCYIAYMPRKNKEEMDIIKGLLRKCNGGFCGLNCRGHDGGSPFWKYPAEFTGIRLIEIDNLSETQVVEALQKADIFLAISREEGFGLPPLEASLCGCLLIGYHGRGGKEWLTDKTCVLTKSPQEFPIRIEEAIRGQHEDKRLALQQLIKEHLTVEKERMAWLDVINHAIKLYSRRFKSRDP